MSYEYEPGIYRVKCGYKHIVIAEHPNGDLHCFYIPKYMLSHKLHPSQIRVAGASEFVDIPTLDRDGNEV